MPRARAVCFAVAFLLAGLVVEPGSGCSGPGSAYSGDSSCGGLHPQSCISSESSDERRGASGQRYCSAVSLPLCKGRTESFQKEDFFVWFFMNRTGSVLRQSLEPPHGVKLAQTTTPTSVYRQCQCGAAHRRDHCDAAHGAIRLARIRYLLRVRLFEDSGANSYN